MGDCVLVAGGAGYIGSHVAKCLAEQGFDPVVLDDLSSGHEWAVRWGRLFRADICDRAALAAIFAEIRPVAVMHLAGIANARDSVAAPAPYWRCHVEGTQALAEAMVAAETRHMVFSSSAAIYGVPRTERVAETHSRNPITPYGESKAAAEALLTDFAAAGRMRSVSLRYFNAAGADPQAGLGEARDRETHLIPLALDVACGRAPTVTVFGTDHPTADGTAVRDYVHVGDLAEAHVAALRHLLAGGDSAALNLGSGRGASVREILDTVGRVSGQTIPTLPASRHAGDPPHLVADVTAAERVLGWRPRRSAIERVVLDAWHWHRTWRNEAESGRG